MLEPSFHPGKHDPFQFQVLTSNCLNKNKIEQQIKLRELKIEIIFVVKCQPQTITDGHTSKPKDQNRCPHVSNKDPHLMVVVEVQTQGGPTDESTRVTSFKSQNPHRWTDIHANL